jgi:hypothetical protein
MVVLVLITNCHVSLYPNKGPVIDHTRMTPVAATNAAGLPVARAVTLAKWVNHEVDLVGRIFFSGVLNNGMVRLKQVVGYWTVNQLSSERPNIDQIDPHKMTKTGFHPI